MSYKLKHTAEEVDYKLDLINKNKNLLPYPYNTNLVGRDLPAGLDNVGDGSILTSSKKISEKEFLLNTCTLPVGKGKKYTVSLDVTNIVEEALTDSAGFALKVNIKGEERLANIVSYKELDLSSEAGDLNPETGIYEIAIEVWLCVPTTFDIGLVIKPQIEEGVEKTAWVPYMEAIGTYVDERFNGTNAKIKILADQVDALEENLNKGGSGTQTLSANSTALGDSTIAGCKGYYWSAIDPENKVMLLTAEQTFTPITTTITKPTDPDFICDYKAEDVVSIINGSKYVSCCTITGINGNMLTFTTDTEEFPFDKASGGDGFDDSTIYVVAKPEIGTVDIGINAVATGVGTKAVGYSSTAEGRDTVAEDQYGHAEGRKTVARYAAHAEGYETKAYGQNAHAEGRKTRATGNSAHAEGLSTSASGVDSHAEGKSSDATGDYSHAEGNDTTASGEGAHSEGYKTSASGAYSHAGGYYTKAAGEYQTVIGKFNKPTAEDDNSVLFIVGNGTANSTKGRSNAFTVNADGTATVASAPKEKMDLANKDYVDEQVKVKADKADTLEGYGIKAAYYTKTETNTAISTAVNKHAETTNTQITKVTSSITSLEEETTEQFKALNTKVDKEKQTIATVTLDTDESYKGKWITIATQSTGSHGFGSFDVYVKRGSTYAETLFHVEARFIENLNSNTLLNVSNLIRRQSMLVEAVRIYGNDDSYAKRNKALQIKLSDGIANSNEGSIITVKQSTIVDKYEWVLASGQEQGGKFLPEIDESTDKTVFKEIKLSDTCKPPESLLTMSKEEFNNITAKDPNTIYFVY